MYALVFYVAALESAALLVHRVPEVLQVVKVLVANPVQKVIAVTSVWSVTLDQIVQLDLLEFADLRAILVHLEKMVPRVTKVLLVKKVFKEILVNLDMESVVLLVTLVIQVLRVLKVSTLSII